MKKLFVIFSLLTAILLPGLSFAQKTDTVSYKQDSTLPKVEFGLKIGANMQTISGNTWDHDYKTGIVGGLTMGLHKKKIGVRGEILVNTSQYVSPKITDSAGNKTILNLVYLNIPVLFEYSIIPALKIQAGLQYSNLISVKSKQGLEGAPKSIFKEAEFSAIIGLEVTLPKQFSAGVRYIYGLSNINNDIVSSASSDAWKNQTIQLYVGYRFQ